MKISKIYLIVFGLLLISFKSSEISKSGILFIKGNYKEAVLKANEEDKFIFMYVYAKWCGSCKKLKKTSFKDAEVGNYYNSNFINVQIDGESDEGRKLVTKFKITQYPTLLILNQKGTVLTKTTGYMKPYILINFGRRIVPKN